MLPTVRIRALAGSTAAFLALSGCAALEVVDCAGTDWEARGTQDGAEGEGPEAIPRYQAICDRQGGQMDMVAYRAGMAEGLRRYCVPATAFTLGAGNEPVVAACPSDLRQAFEDAYASGRQVWQTQEQAQALRREIRLKHQELDAVEVDLDAAQGQILASGLSWAQRTERLSMVSDLGRQREVLRNALGQLRAQLAAAESVLAQSAAMEAR